MLFQACMFEPERKYMLCVYSHLIIFHELYGFGVSMENVALWLRVYSVFSIQCICMSKDNLNHPGILIIIPWRKNIWFSQNWQEFFSEIFLFKKKINNNIFSISFSEIQWGCFAKLCYTKISPERFNQ